MRPRCPSYRQLRPHRAYSQRIALLRSSGSSLPIHLRRKARSVRRQSRANLGKRRRAKPRRNRSPKQPDPEGREFDAEIGRSYIHDMGGSLELGSPALVRVRATSCRTEANRTSSDRWLWLRRYRRARDRARGVHAHPESPGGYVVPSTVPVVELDPAACQGYSRYVAESRRTAADGPSPINVKIRSIYSSSMNFPSAVNVASRVALSMLNATS